MIKKIYLPALYPSFAVLEIRSWTHENKEDTEIFRGHIEQASRAISEDYSVQMHFGKVWQRNIMLNLKQCSAQRAHVFPIKKTALIVAAGPSLDDVIPYIQQNRISLYVIATDTAYHSFLERGIVCDAVVSIDGQAISATHFHNAVHINDTLFIFDLCANSSAVRFVKKNGGIIIFVQTGHPLAQYASYFSKEKTGAGFPKIETGAGTVTIAAADFAKKAGFTKLIIAGADFSYSQKPYTKGTYLDTLYNMQSLRINTPETIFNDLMFRTELTKKENGNSSTPILDAYSESFKMWLSAHCKNAVYNNSLYTAVLQSENIAAFSHVTFDFKQFTKQFIHDFSESYDSKFAHDAVPPTILALLPAAASIQAKTKGDFHTYLKLAYNDILRYI